jgi:hypothetical protein
MHLLLVLSWAEQYEIIFTKGEKFYDRKLKRATPTLSVHTFDGVVR